MHSFTNLEIVLTILAVFSLLCAVLISCASYQGDKLNWQLSQENSQLRIENAQLVQTWDDPDYQPSLFEQHVEAALRVVND